MTLTFSHLALLKRHRDQTTIIHVVNIACKYLLLATSAAKEFFGKHCNNVDFLFCIMLESKYFFSTVNFRDQRIMLSGRHEYQFTPASPS